MYLVTGATGNVGSQLVDQLLDSGRQVRVFTRDASKVAKWGDRVQVAIGDLNTPESFASALAGVEAVFLMNGALQADRFDLLLAAAKAHGQPRLVFLSTIFASEPDILIGRLHKDKENAIRESGLRASFVRAGGFMTNAYQWIGSIKAEGVVYNPMGSGRSAPVAPADIAAVAFKALTIAELAGEVFDITGGELLTVSEQVKILGDVLGRPLRCVDVPVEAAIQGLLRSGLPPHVATAVGQSFEAVRDGRDAEVRGTVARVTGRPPKTFEAWARENAARFA